MTNRQSSLGLPSTSLISVEQKPSLASLLKTMPSRLPEIDDEVQRFCASAGISLEADSTTIWAHIGAALFQRDFRSHQLRRRGRPKGAYTKKHVEIDEKIIAVVESVAPDWPDTHPEKIITKAVRIAERNGKLPSAERSTHPTRVKTKWRARHRAKERATRD